MGTIADKASKVLDTKQQIAAAIEEKTGTNPGNVFAGYPDAIRAIPTGGGSGWTGHADAEGLKSIGWTDEDISYYQEHGVNWNEEDDAYHKVPDDNKALYGVINIDNIQDYKDILVYLPKIDTTGVTSMYKKFDSCYSLVAIPMIDTSSVTIYGSIFRNCYSLICIPLLDTSSVQDMGYMFQNCYSLISIPLFDTSSVTNMGYMFQNCYSLISVLPFDASSATTVVSMFQGCCSLIYISLTNITKLFSITNIFYNAISLIFCNINGLNLSIDISATSLLEKPSLLYMIENAAPTSTITITLSAYCYNKFSNDPDVLAALSSQPLVSLASA